MVKDLVDARLRTKSAAGCGARGGTLGHIAKDESRYELYVLAWNEHPKYDDSLACIESSTAVTFCKWLKILATGYLHVIQVVVTLRG
jgi:hypothetical protein